MYSYIALFKKNPLKNPIKSIFNPTHATCWLLRAHRRFQLQRGGGAYHHLGSRDGRILGVRRTSLVVACCTPSQPRLVSQQNSRLWVDCPMGKGLYFFNNNNNNNKGSPLLVAQCRKKLPPRRKILFFDTIDLRVPCQKNAFSAVGPEQHFFLRFLPKAQREDTRWNGARNFRKARKTKNPTSFNYSLTLSMRILFFVTLFLDCFTCPWERMGKLATTSTIFFVARDIEVNSFLMAARRFVKVFFSTERFCFLRRRKIHCRILPLFGSCRGMA